MSRRRQVVRLGVPALIVAGLALVALWRIGPPPPDPRQAIATTGNLERRATLERIEVRQLTSGRTFWAGRIDEPPVFVFVDPQAARTPGVVIQPGRLVSLAGDVRAVPAEDEMRREWGIDAATAAAVREVGTYLHAKEVR